ncbi:SDR family oxidoreductase [Staphylococcus edaphicus]|uniref:D-mannonate oxidoreductase n=1 Tax=Staphylococcus edaphicus TaxID=1955013 RepID=A0A2C6WKR5_9STAP|nr:SDR family oxidoreductase [Staphylococcus edaphicus]PHK48959.1 D-mannonate oxidoreductase [Staphylococcus edaphicus]UQW81954.1 SDR family oxidoreductase [Staphylococcus edaphicus]
MLPFNVDLKDKNIVVTGGAGVLGAEMSKSLAKCGANIIIIGIDEPGGNKVVKEIENLGGKALSIVASVTERTAMENAKTMIHNRFGEVDILINGAGGNHPKGTTDDECYQPQAKGDIKSFFELDEKSVGFVFDLNFLGTFIPSQVFAKDMINKDDAAIINISSMNAFTPLTKIPAYSGAKAAISNFTQWLSVYFSKTNIRVNAIAPGFLLTDQNRALLLNKDGSYTERSEKILNATPMGRFGEPDELIGALLFLVSQPASSFINGIVLPIDGGFSAYSGV